MSTHENTSSEKRDVCATVTSQIVNAIEKGVGTWRMPWHTSGEYAFSPINVTSKGRIAVSTRFVCGLLPKQKATNRANGARTSNGRTVKRKSAKARSPPP
jgi:hypothetical protein